MNCVRIKFLPNLSIVKAHSTFFGEQEELWLPIKPGSRTLKQVAEWVKEQRAKEYAAGSIGRRLISSDKSPVACDAWIAMQ